MCCSRWNGSGAREFRSVVAAAAAGSAGCRCLVAAPIGQVSEVDEAAGVCLACKLLPEGDLTIRPLGLLQKQLSK